VSCRLRGLAAGGLLAAAERLVGSTNLRVTARAPQPTLASTVTESSLTAARELTSRFRCTPLPCTSTTTPATRMVP
jgi:hypothetical protein